MPETKEYDIVIIGAGPGGYEGAVLAAKHGLKVAIVDKGMWGGVCLNIGCIPTKALLKSAKLYREIVSHGKEFGVDIKNESKNLTSNWAQMQERKRQVVTRLVNGVNYLLKTNKVDQFQGTATAVDNHTIKVDDKVVLKTKNIIIGIGTTPRYLPIKGFAEGYKANIMLDSTAILELKELPKSLTIIGGGVIGVEFALLMLDLDVKVNLVEAVPTLLANLDVDASKEMQRILIERGANLYTSSQIHELKGHKLSITHDGQKKELESDYFLECVGRSASIEGFESLNMDLDPRGYIKVNSKMQTNIPNVYAIGDITGKLLLAHVATAQCKTAALNIAGIEKRIEKYENIANVVYTFPEIASVGKTEQQLQKENIAYIKSRVDFKAVGKAWVDGYPIGYVKMLAEPKYGTILGAQILTETADDMIAQFAMAIKFELSVFDLADVVFPHPSLSEAIMMVCDDWINKYNKQKK